MFIARQITFIGLLVLSMVGGVGCSPSSPNQQAKVSGTVKLDGQPLANGEITFESPEDGGRILATGEITDGKYEVEAMPGQKLVRISAPKKTGKVDDTGVEMTQETIPAIYNTSTTLKANVTSEGPNQFDYDLKPSR